MKNTYLLLTAFIAVALSACNSDTQTEPIPEFSVTFPVAGDQDAFRLISVSDGLVIVGTSSTSVQTQLLLLKVDLNGNLLWQRQLADGTEGFGIKPTSDGNMIVAGSITDENGDKDIYLAKVDAVGNVLWQKEFGGAFSDSGRDVIELQGGGFMLIGNTQSFGAGVVSMYAIRTDADGNMLWQRTFGGEGLDAGTELVQVNNVAVMLLGFTNSFGAGDRDIYLQGVSIEGDSLGSFTYGGPAYEETQSFQRTSDGGFVMCNHSASTEPNHSLLATRLNANMQTVWQNEYGTPTAHEGGEGVLADSEGNFVFLGRTNSYGPDEQVYFIKTDANGNTLEELNLGEAGDQRGADIIEHDGSYFICGVSIVDGISDVLLIKRPM
jgi:hypothetical protein